MIRTAPESFVIQFSFPIENSTIVVHLQATVTAFDKKDGFYQVSFFKLISKRSKKPIPSVHASVLPEMQIRPVNLDGRMLWVHKDSEKETSLSAIIGKCIEEVLSITNLQQYPT